MRLLVTGAWQQAAEHIPLLESRGHEVMFMQQERDALPCDPGWVEGIVGNGVFLFHPMALFENLRYVQLTSAGFDRVPMDEAARRGIIVENARGVYSAPMAEFALCGVLALYKQWRFFSEGQRAHRWEKHRGLLELAGKQIVVVGCGSVGTACAKRFRALDAAVTGVDLFPREDAAYEAMSGLDGLDAALARADVVVLTVPLTDETRGLMNGARIAGMKPGAVLVNIARGGVLDTPALIEGLRTRLGGAVLDVFDSEPLPPDSPLWDMENVIVTPHNSFVGEGNGSRLSRVIMDNLERHTNG